VTSERSFQARAPRFHPPPGACDTHVHVFGPAGRYPFAPTRTYTPTDAVPDQAAAMLARLGIDRVVVVQPSVYGADNRRLLDALDELGPRARGVAVITAAMPADEMARLARCGVAGARLNVAAEAHGEARSFARDLVSLGIQVAPQGWHVQVHIGSHLLSALEEVVALLPVAVVIDHFGMVRAAPSRDCPATDSLRRLLETGKIWLKLSAPYRTSGSDSDFEAAGNLARVLVSANPERLLWGSDWPHTPPHSLLADRDGTPAPFRRVDTAALLDAFAEWIPNEADRTRILVDNPARLYGFAAADGHGVSCISNGRRG